MLRLGSMRTVFCFSMWRITTSQTGGPCVPSLTEAQPDTVYFFSGSIAAPESSVMPSAS